MSHIINKIGLEVFGVVSICLFVSVFSTAMIWSLCLKKAFLIHMEKLPLQDNQGKVNDPDRY
jgi:hypothetical protein